MVQDYMPVLVHSRYKSLSIPDAELLEAGRATHLVPSFSQLPSRRVAP